MTYFIQKSSIVAAVFCIVLSFSNAAAQQFVNSGQNLPGLYAGSAEWGFFDAGSSPDLLLTGLDGAGTPQTLIYENSLGVLTQVANSITGIYFGDARWSDFDNDGDLDILIVGLDSDDNSIAEVWNNQGGTYVKDNNQTLTGLRYASVAWGDYNNDGLTDAITTGMDRLGESRTILYRNVKVGLQNILVEETLQPLLNISKGSAAFGDVDNDGDLDLVISGFDAAGFANAAVYVNDPIGFFTFDNRNSSRIQKLTSGTLVWGDADGDGFSDLLQTGLSSVWKSGIIIYENERDGTIAGNLLETAEDLAGKAVWGDLGNDGIFDIAVSGKNEFSALFGNILDGQSGGTFNERQLEFSGLRDGALSLADYDSDGKLDILVSGVNDTGEFTTILYRNTTSAPGTVPQPPASVEEAVVTNNNIILNWSRGTDALVSEDFLSYNLRIGRQGVVNAIYSGIGPIGPGNVGSKLRYTVNTQLAEGSYTFSVQTVNARYERSAWSQERLFKVEQFVSSLQNISGFQFASMAWGDYDNDGDPDLVTAGTDANGNNRTAFYINENGVLKEDRTVNNNLIKFNYGDFSWGDYDNDGDLDLAYTGFFIRESATSGIYINNGGVLTELREPFTPVGFASLDWGDYDNDGDLDLAVMGKSTAGPFVTKIYRNDGGVLAEDTNQNLIGYALGTLQWVDHDNDGDLDLSISGQSSNSDNKVRIYKNDPVGTLLEDSNNANLPAFPSSDIDWADIDDDGDLDLIVTGVYQNAQDRTVIFRNSPTGTLTEDAILSSNLRGGRGGALTVGDYDNDGDPDIVVTGFDALVSFEPILKLYKNNSLIFNEEVLSIIEGNGIDFSTVSLVDIDGDGDIELIALGRKKFDESTFLASATVYDNVSARNNPNSAPQEVSGLTAKIVGGTVTLSWSPTIDFPIGDPNRDSLTYQIRVGTTFGGNEIVSGAQEPEIGRFGSITHRTITGLISGDYTWSVRAVDNGLAASEWSPEKSFRIDTDPPSVTAASVTITPDSTGVNTVTMFIVIDENFELDLSISPNVIVTLSGDAAVPVNTLSYSGNTWIGELEILEQFSSGMAALSVSGITDAVGNVMIPADEVKEFFIDTQRPQVITTDPPFTPDGVSEGVKTSITLKATFGEVLDPASVSNEAFKLFKGSQEISPSSDVILSNDGMSVSVLFSNLDSETEYRVIVVSILRDKVGNTMQGDFSWQFKTTLVLSAADGGSIASADSSVVIFFPPNAIANDIAIPIEKTDPFPLPEGVTFVNVAFHIGPEIDLQLNKPTQIRIGYTDEILSQVIGKTAAKTGSAFVDEQKLALYIQQSSNLSVWDRIGGTINTENNTITASVSKLGTFGLFEDLTATGPGGGISEITFSPRVFSPRGTGNVRNTTSVNYSLGTATNVTIRIFNTAGRSVRRLINNLPRNAGQNSDEWDGTDGDGRILPTGLYIVQISAGGSEKIKSVAISNQ